MGSVIRKIHGTTRGMVDFYGKWCRVNIPAPWILSVIQLMVGYNIVFFFKWTPYITKPFLIPVCNPQLQFFRLQIGKLGAGSNMISIATSIFQKISWTNSADEKVWAAFLEHYPGEPNAAQHKSREFYAGMLQCLLKKTKTYILYFRVTMRNLLEQSLKTCCGWVFLEPVIRNPQKKNSHPHGPISWHSSFS